MVSLQAELGCQEAKNNIESVNIFTVTIQVAGIIWQMANNCFELGCNKTDESNNITFAKAKEKWGQDKMVVLLETDRGNWRQRNEVDYAGADPGPPCAQWARLTLSARRSSAPAPDNSRASRRHHCRRAIAAPVSALCPARSARRVYNHHAERCRRAGVRIALVVRVFPCPSEMLSGATAPVPPVNTQCAIVVTVF
ncbi:hypothetical protein CBL_11787 [Carabus blaptoides fortunei]